MLDSFLKADPGNGFKFQNSSFGDILSQGIQVAYYIAAFLVLFWFSWGAFQYIFAGGNKEGLQKAKSRMTWAIVGFIILILAFALSQFAEGIFPQNNLSPVTITP